MTNVNQGSRAGNIFGTPFGGGHGNNGMEYALKPGYVIKARNNFYVIEAREALSVDLFFTDSHVITVSSNVVNGGADGTGLLKYGPNSVSALLGPTGGLTAGTKTASILSPNFDSGYIKFDDLEPSFGHLYQLCPTLPFQPKFIDGSSGEFLMPSTPASTGMPSNGGVPLGFIVADGATPIGAISSKLYIF